MASAIEIDRLAFAWQGDQLTLDIPHWQVEAGETVLLRGPSGSGKSTLLSLLAGINVAKQGSVKLLEQSLSELSGRKRDRFRADHIGYIFQQFNLLPYLSALDNVLLATRFSPKRRQRVTESGQSAEQLAIQYLQRLGLSATQQQAAANLSVGQQQRVAAARALLGAPELLIADEPTSALDSDRRDDFIKLLLELSEQNNTTVLFVTHDASLGQYFNRHVELSDINQAVGGSSHA
ncbi:ABC transporter ATP-binding protein [Idiomarina sp.]|uniref:ABC transporter ATP-binding protein n=1 Tax=Idiomarina sp. TaxID=1874361 RepID=UPI0025B8DDCC|nr:ABC transporter ATP-binding protein [Idiomarina sp.]NQZ05320.1 ABC transporter ATP-binding protein [Idiomarina sp.]